MNRRVVVVGDALLNDWVFVVAKSPREANAEAVIDHHQAAVEEPVKGGTEAKPVGRIGPEAPVRAPRHDMTGDEGFLDGQARNATAVVVAAENRGAEEILVDALLAGRCAFRVAVRGREVLAGWGFRKSTGLGNLCGGYGQGIPIGVELVPNVLVEPACMRQSADVAPAQLRVECTEVAELASNGCWGAVQRFGDGLDLRVSLMGLPERNPTVEVERKD